MIDAKNKTEVVGKEIVPAQPRVVRPLQTAEEAAADFREYQRLTQAILDSSDYQQIQGTQFKKKSAWRKYGKAFNLSDEIVEETIVRRHDEKTCELARKLDGATMRECSCPTTYARYRVRALAPNGRTTEGVGVCSVREQRGFSKPEHDIPATAHTRAKNRAISDMIGAGEVSAEEATADAADTDKTPQFPMPQADVDAIKARYKELAATPEGKKIVSGKWAAFMKEEAGDKWSTLWSRAELIDEARNILGMASEDAFDPSKVPA